jgi:hypothetical protein
MVFLLLLLPFGSALKGSLWNLTTRNLLVADIPVERCGRSSSNSIESLNIVLPLASSTENLVGEARGEGGIPFNILNNTGTILLFYPSD